MRNIILSNVTIPLNTQLQYILQLLKVKKDHTSWVSRYSLALSSTKSRHLLKILLHNNPRDHSLASDSLAAILLTMVDKLHKGTTKVHLTKEIVEAING